MKISVFKKCIAFFLLISRCFVIYGSDYFTDSTPEYLPNKYTLDDKKILELDVSSNTYDSKKDTMINTIIIINNIEFSFKGSFNTEQNWKITKLIDYFKQSVVNLTMTFSDIQQNNTINPIKLSEKLKQYKGNFYYTHIKTENYYGVNYQLTGKNLIGKMIQKMRDDPNYIPRAQQKIEASEQLIEELHSKAKEYNKASQATGWQNIKEAVYFYDKEKRYYEFTNFFNSQVYVDGIIWPTSEHYYQSMKFTQNPDLRKKILNSATPRDAFTIAQQNKITIDKDWQSRSLKTMIKIVWLKFNQHDDLKELLLTTGKKTLIEDAGNKDAFYGAGADYKGNNWLGCILMAVRDKLKKQKEEEQKKLTKKNNPSEINNQSPKQSLSSFPNQSSQVFVANSTSPKTESWLAQVWEAIKSFFSWLFG